MSDFSNYMQYHFANVSTFNHYSGNKNHKPHTEEWWDSIVLQASLVREEGIELHEAALCRDKKETLKEAIDVLVVAFRMIEMLEKAGYDVDKAFNDVNINNMSKIYDYYHQAITEKELLEERDNKEYTIDSSLMDGIEKFVIRREDGKVMKRVDHTKVDLSRYIPLEEEE